MEVETIRWKKISDAVVRRLPLYMRVLDELARDGEKVISSQDLGDKAGVGSALVRKDLAWFGEFGKQGVGYDIDYLRIELRKILNLEKEIRVVLVGAGSLGTALCGYLLNRFRNDSGFGLHIVAILDQDPQKVGKEYFGVPVHPISEAEQIIKSQEIELGIVTVPGHAAQTVAETMVDAGVKAMLNFAPVKLNVPDNIEVANADLSLELQRLAYYLLDE